jgi:tetratricopeptide (TPR) repeat protein
VDLERIFKAVDAPTGNIDSSDLVYQNDIGIRFADTALPGAPLLIVRVDDPGGQLKVGDVIEAVEGMPATAQGLADRVRRSKAGDKITLRVGSMTSVPQPREVTVGRKPRRAPVFDPNLQGNVIIAKLSATALAPPPGADPQLFNFSLAAAYLRFGDYKAASDLLEKIGNVPAGAGVGRGPALYLKARALEAQGQKDLALTALKEAAGFKDQIFADDGAGVGTIADRHAASLSKTP